MIIYYRVFSLLFGVSAIISLVYGEKHEFAFIMCFITQIAADILSAIKRKV